MSRVTKDPQVRMNEFIDTAEELFNAHGYYETQISDIVKTIGVAQGTFYYYFKSKEDIVEAIVQRKVEQVVAETEDIVVAKDIDSPHKMSSIVNTVLASVHDRFGLIFEYLYSEQNLHILDKLGRQVSVKFAAPLKNVIEEGIEQGCFKVAYPEETVDFILQIVRVLLDSLYQKAEEKHARRMEIAQKLIETALGARAGSLSFKS